jgi:putative peptidoglycan lipid II flippase
MSPALWWMMGILLPNFSSDILTRVSSLILLVGGGMAIYFAVGYLVGALDKDQVNRLLRRSSPATGEA